ncbi:MAG: phage shock protein PspA [Rhodospirillales bacterium]
MSIFSRLADIVNSNLNALLASAEDPEKIIRLIIQEMEDTLVEVRSSAVRTIAERRDLERRAESLRREEDEWQRKAELALARGREDLARGALTAKSHRAQARANLDQQIAVLTGGLSQQNDDITKLQAKLADAKKRQQSLAARRTTAGNRLMVREKLHDDRINDAFFRFEQAERSLDHLEGRVEAFDLGRGKGSVPTLEDELAALEANEAVDAELAALKARLGNSLPAGEAAASEKKE